MRHFPQTRNSDAILHLIVEKGRHFEIMLAACRLLASSYSASAIGSVAGPAPATAQGSGAGQPCNGWLTVEVELRQEGGGGGPVQL